MNPSTEKRLVHSELIAGGDTFQSWARKHGYYARSVTQAVDRYVGKPDKKPWGHVTYCILRDLSKTLGRRLHPVVREEDLK